MQKKNMELMDAMRRPKTPALVSENWVPVWATEYAVMDGVIITLGSW